MIYRQLGNTGLRISRLGFGAMRLPMKGSGKEALVDRELAVPMIHYAFEQGVNYIDSAVGYCNSDSQCAVGDALKGWRDKIVVSTKNPYYGEDEKEWWQNLEDSLKRLHVDYIDIYNHHGMGLEAYEKEVAPRLSKWMAKAKEQGLIRHICNSFHDNCDALKKLVDSGYTESITLQYNMLDRQLEEGMAYAHEKGVGIVVMGPVGGGRLAGSPVLEKLVPGISRVPELALRFVLANPNVDIALSGMSTMSQVVENTATVSGSSRMTEGEREAILEHVQQLEKMADLYCTGCGYCQPCPHEVNIPVIFEKYNWGRVYGLWESARGAYDNLSRNEWNPGKRADACVLCGKCEEKCPQHLPIREQLKEAHEKLRKKDEG